MPYKRPNSPYYQIRRRSLPGYGDTGVLTTKSTSKRIARRMENLLEEIAERALLDPTWIDLLDAVCEERSITLPELLKAKSRSNLDRLCRQLHDPHLSEAIAQYREEGRVTRQTEVGLNWLEEKISASTRLSDLDAKTIMRLCREAEAEGRKRNSVRRYQMRAMSLLLRHHMGEAERNRIFDEVQYEAEDDTREVHLLPAEIKRLLDACRSEDKPLYDELAVIIRLALQTSADRGVLLAGDRSDGTARGLRVRDVRIYHNDEKDTYSGQLYLHDQKTEERSRSVPLTDYLARELLILAKGKGPDDPIFNMRYQQLDYRWQRVRKKAGLEHVRFKDLRAQTAIYGEEAGVPQTVLQHVMGHSDDAMTRRYQRRAASLSEEQAAAIENVMFGKTG